MIHSIAREISNRLGFDVEDGEILESLSYVAEKTHTSPEKIIRVVRILLKSNVFCIKPRIWKKSKKSTSKDELLRSFIEDMNQFQIFNTLIPLKSQRIFRIMSYNVHFWEHPYTQINTYSEIMNIIRHINPDLVGLQEVEADGTYILPRLIEMGYNLDVCKASKIGNILGTKSALTDSLSILLPYGKEKRCVVVGEINICGIESVVAVVHLDVWDKTGITRRKEINVVLEYLDKNYPSTVPKIILGDFNSLREEDYSDREWEWLKYNSRGHIDTETIKYIEDKGYRDLFTGVHLKYTVWSGRRVDYIFVKDFPFRVSSAQVFYSTASDHLPLIVDIQRI